MGLSLIVMVQLVGNQPTINNFEQQKIITMTNFVPINKHGDMQQ